MSLRRLFTLDIYWPAVCGANTFLWWLQKKMHPIILLALFAVLIEQSVSNYQQCASEPAYTVFVNTQNVAM